MVIAVHRVRFARMLGPRIIINRSSWYEYGFIIKNDEKSLSLWIIELYIKT